ncbi:hypothetical protein LPB140_01640 [Sphingorhabdus lutea]|uniref:Fatty acid hydroxylase domain-containing protein n=1 Tax=Sphingorhabdus lutea TaxID=1913578 RepID=A0A1L3J9D1_9SPHN|nr:sterol desaturase family protein [Sphingorhabdus lutea]APG61746.1 hypothetical protein LPB140_01640 [Sphingorhabdus lutea]
MTNAAIPTHIILAIAASSFFVFAIAERLWPNRRRVMKWQSRWLVHLVFFILNSILGRALIAVMTVSIAANWAQDNNFGLFNIIALPWWLVGILIFIIMDFWVWFQHLLMHKIPILWRAHIVHHSDRDLDVTSALRFHPLELIFSTLFKSTLVAIFGVPIFWAILFEIWLNIWAMFTHSNIRLPHKFDHLLGALFVTPDMHLIHHHIIIDDQQKNYGFALNLWDKIFGQYRAQPMNNSLHDMKLGLDQHQDKNPAKLRWTLLLPFLVK